MQTTDEISYTIIRKRGLKHTYIQIQKDGSVIIKANHFVSKKSIHHFVEKKRTWILKKQITLQQIHLKNSDNIIRYLGQSFTKEAFYDLHPLENPQTLNLFYKNKAKEIILPLVEKWSTLMMQSPTYVGFRKNRTRWGSCSSKNRLSFNTKLTQMHPDFIEYVVVHELAHIKHKNHSKDFWCFVAEFLPDYKERQNLVKI